jgi:hypothetical protein
MHRLAMTLPASVVAVWLATSPAHAADPTGRLFFTPQQRAILDAARVRSPVPEPELTPAPVVAQPELPPPPPARVTVNGIVRRSDGSETLWVNDKVLQNRQMTGGVAVGGVDGNRVSVRLPEGGSVSVKVGQTVEPSSGKVTETYRDRPSRAVRDTAPGQEAQPYARRPVRPRGNEAIDGPPPDAAK